MTAAAYTSKWPLQRDHTEENRMIQTYQHAPLYEERQQAFEALGRKLTLLSDPDAMHNEKIIQFNKYR